jgi:hypothetical protein
VLRFLSEVVDRTNAAARQTPPDPAAG